MEAVRDRGMSVKVFDRDGELEEAHVCVNLTAAELAGEARVQVTKRVPLLLEPGTKLEIAVWEDFKGHPCSGEPHERVIDQEETRCETCGALAGIAEYA